MKPVFISSLTRAFHKVGLQLRKHSPEILVVAGVAGTVASAVMACKATTKLSAVLEKGKEEAAEIHDFVETNGCSDEYTEEDYKKDIAITHVHTGLNVFKLYAPAVGIGILSIAAILTSNNIIRKRNVALAAAYATVDAGFKEYRGRVIERFGKELDRELKYNIKSKTIEEIVLDEKGKETTVTSTVDVADIHDHSVYAKFFDESCLGWEKNADYNLMFLRQKQNWFNDLLKSRGHVFLNEVYDGLGMERTSAGAIVGWVYDEKNPVGDNFIDFGIYDLYDEAKRLFVNGHERSILLDFNVDGVIYDLLH